MMMAAMVDASVCLQNTPRQWNEMDFCVGKFYNIREIDKMIDDTLISVGQCKIYKDILHWTNFNCGL